MPKGGRWWGSDDESEAKLSRNLNTTLLVEAMSSCTAITYVNGSLVGDPLDVQMFEATGWVLDESEQVRSAEGENDQLVIAYVYPRPGAPDPKDQLRASP